jgi:hypothetical protein
MLRSISWGQYWTFILVGLILFYAWLHRRFRIFQPIIERFFSSPQKKSEPVQSETPPKPPTSTQLPLFFIALLIATSASAQNADGNAGINQANTLIRSYFTTATQLMYAISAVIGLAGAIHVYVKMLRGHHDTQQAATAWFSACIFIAVVATVIQFFFGL